MNSSFLKKTAIIMTVVLVITLIPAFARGGHRSNRGNNYDGYSHNRSSYNGGSYGHNGGGCGSRGYSRSGSGYNAYGCNSYGHGGGCNGYDCGYGYDGHGYNSGYQLGGTIQLIDTNASTISVANADGALTLVRINPNTNIINMTDFNSMDGYGHMDYYDDIDTDGMTDAEIRLELFNAREAAIEEWEEEIEDRILELDNLKTGDWVEISTLPSETLTREANAISVYR